ncbi:reverse transcriptase domain-containing protein [Tanacetum coccineum]|uniref:Reverse transcriptase domain-containing protein n=1 Tax=Tanacetum coccineum TaxID=301880 RepID=A0ABQ5F1W1_9ASTR
MAAHQAINGIPNLLREFWCTAVATHPNPPADDFKVLHLKEYQIKFSVMNGKKPLTLDYKTFVESTGLDYAKGTYVSHPSLNAIKAELAKIVFDGNYSSTEQDESFGSSLTILSNSKFSKDPSKVTPIELTNFMVVVNKCEHSVNPLPFLIKKMKGKSQTVTPTLPQSQGPEAPGSLPQKRKKPKSKKTPSETKDKLAQESDEEEVFAARDDIEKEDTQVDEEEHQASIEGYYEENVDHKEQTDKLAQATMDPLDKTATDKVNLLNALNGVTKTLKVVQDAVKDDPALNKKVIEATEANIKNLSAQTKLLNLSSNSLAWNLGPRMTVVESSQDEIRSEISYLKQDTSEIKSMMIEIFQAFKDKAKEEPTRAVPISIVKLITRHHPEAAMIESSSRPPLTDPTLEIPVPQREGKGIATEEQLESTKKLVPASKFDREDPDEPMRVPYMINGKMYYLTNDEINAHLEKEHKIKKAVEEAKMFEMTKTEVIKVVQEEAEKIELDPKTIISAKADELGPIIQKKKNTIVKDLMTSLGKRYERLKKILDELGIQSALLAPVLEQAPFESLGRKRKHMELAPEIKVPRLECNRSLPEGVSFINNMAIEEPDNGLNDHDPRECQVLPEAKKVEKNWLEMFVVRVVEEKGRKHEDMELKRRSKPNAKTVAPTPDPVIAQPTVDDNFVINSTHLKMIRENKFDGHPQADPHDHIHEFLAICDMFKYGKTQSEVVKLLIFPYSLSDKAKTWFNELNEVSITSWDQMKRAFINRFFPSSLFNHLLVEIRSFSQNVCDCLTNAWLRLKNMLRKCHGHGLAKRAIIQIFYHGLDELTQEILDITIGGIFLYKSPNQAFQFLDEKVLFKFDWSTKSKNEHHQRSVSFADGSNNDNSRLMEKLEALTIKIDSQFHSVKDEMNEIRKNYNNRDINQVSKNDDTPMCERHEANYIQSEGY